MKNIVIVKIPLEFMLTATHLTIVLLNLHIYTLVTRHPATMFTAQPSPLTNTSHTSLLSLLCIFMSEQPLSKRRTIHTNYIMSQGIRNKLRHNMLLGSS